MNKWRVILLLCLAELLAMAVWFSASAVVPALTSDWGLGPSQRAWLTMSVQIGFVVGTLASALLNLPDKLPAHRLFAASALLAAMSTAFIPLLNAGYGFAIAMRALTGVFLAGVYPVGMKIMATWTKEDRGLGIGLIVGALTIGSAIPHLLNAFNGARQWQLVLYLAAILSLTSSLVALLFITEGPYRAQPRRFNWKYIAEVPRQRPMLLANLGYLGHMWELYAMWAWVPVFLLASFDLTGTSPFWAGIVAFGVVAIGGLGSILAGRLADRLGRTTVTTASLLVSGAIALVIGRLFGSNPYLLAGVCLLWGFAVVADSAQFSACVSELCDEEYLGTALTVQTSAGFLLTLATIWLIPVLVTRVGWEWAFASLAIGPIVGIWAMTTLRRSPAAARLAGGRG